MAFQMVPGETTKTRAWARSDGTGLFIMADIGLATLWRRIFRFLASLKLAVILLLGLAVVLAVATVIVKPLLRHHASAQLRKSA